MAIDKIMNKNISDLSKIIGVTKDNLSKFMGHSVPTSYVFKDTFTGSNGSDPNSTYWNPNQYLKIQSNQLHGAVNGTSGEVISKFILPEDFDISVSFDDLITSTSNGNRIELVAISGDSSELGLIGARYHAGAKFTGRIRHNGVYYGEEVAARSNDYGGLRIIRSGTTMTLQYKDGEWNWTTLTSNTVDGDDLYVRLFVYSSIGAVSGDFDDFTVESGTMA